MVSQSNNPFERIESKLDMLNEAIKQLVFFLDKNNSINEKFIGLLESAVCCQALQAKQTEELAGVLRDVGVLVLEINKKVVVEEVPTTTP